MLVGLVQGQLADCFHEQSNAAPLHGGEQLRRGLFLFNNSTGKGHDDPVSLTGAIALYVIFGAFVLASWIVAVLGMGAPRQQLIPSGGISLLQALQQQALRHAALCLHRSACTS